MDRMGRRQAHTSLPQRLKERLLGSMEELHVIYMPLESICNIGRLIELSKELSKLCSTRSSPNFTTVAVHFHR